ncbi:hypothetical protein [Candidatus Fukatsuia symbiotica]|nr:hypothetical protein [Candidatus Fukatsuia symbiotica]
MADSGSFGIAMTAISTAGHAGLLDETKTHRSESDFGLNTVGILAL